MKPCHYDCGVIDGSHQETQRILVPVLAGIGNAVMTVPLVRRLGALGPLTIAARTEAIADVFRGLNEVAAIEVLGAGYRTAWRTHRRLARQLRPDLYVVPFPSNRWQYSLLAAASGSRRVIMHDYPVGGVRTLRFLPRMLRKVMFVRAERGIHDVLQNLRLLEVVSRASTTRGLAGDVQETPEAPAIALREEDRAAARRQLEHALAFDQSTRWTTHNGQRTFIALQPGCGDTTVGRAKRWPVENFAQLADALAERGRDVIVIEGPEERGVGRQISALATSHPPVIELAGPLKHAAALLERAALYVGTDSGLAHVAAAVGTPPVTLFAAADPVRVAPFGYEHLVVTPSAINGRAWQPRLMYPMDHPGPKLRDAGGIDWAAHIRVEDVLGAIDLAMRAEPEARVRPSGAAQSGEAVAQIAG